MRSACVLPVVLLLLFQISNKCILRIMTVHLTALSTEKNTFSQELIQHRFCHLVIMQHLVEVSVTIGGPTSLRGLFYTQLELPRKTTLNCCSLIKCVFYYWRHYEIFVSDENKKSHSFCCKTVPDSLWLGLMLHLPLDSFTLNSSPCLIPVLAEQSCSHCLSRMSAEL